MAKQLSLTRFLKKTRLEVEDGKSLDQEESHSQDRHETFAGPANEGETATAELNCRFKQDTYGIMQASASFLPRSATFGMKDLLKAPCDLYGLAIGDAEFTVFTSHIRGKIDRGQNFPSLIEVLDSCPEDIFPNINCLLRAIITLPLTSCSVERLFSATNRIKTRLRSSMLTGRLNNLTLLSFERELRHVGL